MSHGSIDPNMLKSHNKATFSPVQYRYPIEEGLELDVYFCSQVDGPVTQGGWGAYKQGDL